MDFRTGSEKGGKKKKIIRLTKHRKFLKAIIIHFLKRHGRPKKSYTNSIHSVPDNETLRKCICILRK